MNWLPKTLELLGESLSEEQKEDYKKWKSLVNMTPSQIEAFLKTQEGDDCGAIKK